MGAYTFVTAREAALMTQWASQGISKKEILRRTGRSKDVLKRHLGRGGAAKVGRKKMVTPAVLRKLKASKKKLQRKAEAEKEVTVAMIKADAGVVASNRVVLDAFHAEDIYFRPLRERPVLTKATYRKGRSGQRSTGLAAPSSGSRTLTPLSTTSTSHSSATVLAEPKQRADLFEEATGHAETRRRPG